MIRAFILLSAGALVAACSGEQTAERDISGELAAEGEVLGGSISDAMIPVESVRSQSRSLRVAPEPQEDDQEVTDLFDALLSGDGEVVEPAAPVVAPPPAPEAPPPPAPQG